MKIIKSRSSRECPSTYMRYRPNAGLMLNHSRRRWFNVKPALVIVCSLNCVRVFAGAQEEGTHCFSHTFFPADHEPLLTPIYPPPPPPRGEEPRAMNNTLPDEGVLSIFVLQFL